MCINNRAFSARELSKPMQRQRQRGFKAKELENKSLASIKREDTVSQEEKNKNLIKIKMMIKTQECFLGAFYYVLSCDHVQSSEGLFLSNGYPEWFSSQFRIGFSVSRVDAELR